MKKYTLFLVVFSFIFGLFSINVNLASAITDPSEPRTSYVEGCKEGDKFSRKTGERCSEVVPKKECASGDLFSSVTGKPCEVINTNSVVISGVKGPQYLDVNQEGTWEVKAYDKNGGDLSYSVIWGDEMGKPSRPMMELGDTGTQQSATFTHSYSKAGKYNPVFYVTSENTMLCIQAPCPSNAGSAKTSLTVKVGEYTEPYIHGKEWYKYNQTLKQNSRGEKVLELQEYLNKKGYDVGKMDGIFGAKVRAAVLQLQSDKKLKIDGVVGPEVWSALGL